jgi:hypothetical protein
VRWRVCVCNKGVGQTQHTHSNNNRKADTMEAPQLKDHRKPFRNKKGRRGSNLFSWAVNAVVRNEKPLPLEYVLKHLREMGYPQVAKQVYVYVAENK